MRVARSCAAKTRWRGLRTAPLNSNGYVIDPLSPFDPNADRKLNLKLSFLVGYPTRDPNPQIMRTTTQSTDTDTSLQPTYSSTSSIGETGQFYVLERLSLEREKRLSTWASETYDAEITLDHVLIDANGTIYGCLLYTSPSPRD